ncbi:hypothetical protein MRV_0035 [Murid herpesvirus 3]|uniref:Uncharacterized protein n=2 Tax=Murid betaherpesvirus 3 TaxID=2560603 RepID=A0A1P8VIR4_9BETA|nr:hypothetical protein MRV_0035 [Murine roseolovirus]APZ76246.1 hypothetical protein MRV_0035 [Murid betaherpesvirus 3]AYH64752.1 hypothetical protein MRV_0035 [Murid herpesvirus 3]
MNKRLLSKLLFYCLFCFGGTMDSSFNSMALWKDRFNMVSDDLINFQHSILTAMKDKVVIPHSNGLFVRIGDYSCMGYDQILFERLSHGFYPFNGKLIVFGTMETKHPVYRTVAIIVCKSLHVLIYEDGKFFYISPNIRRFWDVNIFFNDYNIIAGGKPIDYYLKYYDLLKTTHVTILEELPPKYVENQNSQNVILNTNPPNNVSQNYLLVQGVSDSEYFCRISQDGVKTKINTFVSRGTQYESLTARRRKRKPEYELTEIQNTNKQSVSSIDLTKTIAIAPVSTNVTNTIVTGTTADVLLTTNTKFVVTNTTAGMTAIVPEPQNESGNGTISAVTEDKCELEEIDKQLLPADYDVLKLW